MQYYVQYAVLGQLALAVFMSFIFSRKYENRGLMEGARFGFYAGIFMGIIQATSYAYMPITGALVFLWFVGAILEGIFAGITISAIFRRK